MVPVPTCSEAMVPVQKKTGTGTPKHQYTFGTGTTLTGTSTNMNFLQDLSRIPILVQGYARLSTTASRSLRRMVFKPNEGRRRGVLGILGFCFEQFECFSHIFLGSIE